jgi:hypothetical protein
MCVALYRLPAKGQPVPVGAIAAELDADESEIERTL